MHGNGAHLRAQVPLQTGEVSTGPSPLPVNTTRHCRYRAFGLVIGDPAASPYAADQALQVSSGVSVLPARVNSSTLLPGAAVPRQLIAPHVEIICASCTSDS
jgi:hypothetical protein